MSAAGPSPPYKPSDPRHSDKETPGYLPPDNPGKIVPKPPSYSQVTETIFKPPTFKPNYDHNDNFVKKVPSTTKSPPLTYIPPSPPNTVPNHVPVNPIPRPTTSTTTTKIQPKVPDTIIKTDKPRIPTAVPIGKTVPPTVQYKPTPAPTRTPTIVRPTPSTYVPEPYPTLNRTVYNPPTPNKNVTPRPSLSSNTCVCSDTTSSKTSYSSSTTSTSTYPNPASVDFNKQFNGFNGNANFGSIMSAMSLNQLPVVPAAPGQPAFYPPDKIPKGAVIAFMPVVILPQEYYTNCDENSLHTNINSGNKYQNLDPFPLGVQPAAIPNSFSVHSIFSGNGPRDQCMCPCSCTQNLSKSYKKRETSPEEVPAAAEPVAEAATAEVKVEAPVKVEEVKAEASAPEAVKVEAPAKPVEQVEPVVAASEAIKVEAPIAAAAVTEDEDKSKITTTN